MNLPQGWTVREENHYKYVVNKSNNKAAVYWFDIAGIATLPKHHFLKVYIQHCNSHGYCHWADHDAPEPMPEEITNMEEAAAFAHILYRMS